MNAGLVLPGRAVSQRGRLSISTSLCLLVGGALLWTSGCRPEKPVPGAGKGGRDPIVPVVSARATSEDIPVEISAIGNVQSFSVVSVRSQITAPLLKVHFNEGQEVKSGDLLFTLDARPWEAALNQAQANLKRDEAQISSARLAFLRTSNLFKSNIASQQDYDTAEAVYNALQATALADSAAISNAQVSLGYTTIRAAIDGRTGALNIKAGNVVKVTDDVLATITQVHPVYVAFSVPEQKLPAIRHEAQKRALTVTAAVPGETGPPEEGELTFINNMVDTTTGTILLKATFANSNTVLWPGQFVRVSMRLNTLPQATVVPSQAVQTGQSGDFVYVVGIVGTNQTVEARPVTAGITVGGKTVLSKGVVPGETVVIDGQSRLAPGSKVSIKTPQTANSSTNSPGAPR
jgi:membrane fusion protein, multidrug efflux system